MTAVSFDDPELLAFAEQARMVSLPPRADVLARFSDMEIIDAVVARDGGYLLETSSRGGAAHPVVSSTTLMPIRRELVLRLGAAARHRHRMPRFELPTALPADFDLVERDDRAELTWQVAGEAMTVAFLTGQFAVNDALRFAQLARLPEADLMAAYLDPAARTPTLLQ